MERPARLSEDAALNTTGMDLKTGLAMDQANTDLDSLTREELERALQAALEELDEVNELWQAVLGQTGVHIGMARLNQYRARFDRDRKLAEERVARTRARLAALETKGGKA